VGVKRFLTEPATWTSIGVVLLKFVYGIAAFSVTLTGTALVGTLLATPFLYDAPGASYQLGQHAVRTFPTAVGLAVLGLAGFWLLCNVINILGAAGGHMTDLVLSAGQDADAETGA
jgi:hypothetical protein